LRNNNLSSRLRSTVSLPRLFPLLRKRKRKKRQPLLKERTSKRPQLLRALIRSPKLTLR